MAYRHDITTPEGLAEAAWWELVDELENRGVPLVALVDREVKKIWSTVLPGAGEVEKAAGIKGAEDASNS